MIDVIIGIISVSFLFFMVRIFMKFNSATYKNNFTKNDNFIVENVKVIKIVIAVCTCISLIVIQDSIPAILDKCKS